MAEAEDSREEDGRPSATPEIWHNSGADGKQVRLSDLRGHKVVLVFYRGFW